jgi:hypothetical protein
MNPAQSRFHVCACGLITLLALPATAVDLPGGPGGKEYGPVDESLFGTSPILQFAVDEGRIHNRFYRRGPVAAHVLVRSGPDPRLLVAFPAGNEGAGVWFETPGRDDVTLTVEGALEGIWTADEPWGVFGAVSADTDRLRLSRLCLGSVRVLRGVEATGTFSAAFADQLSVQVEVGDDGAVVKRTLIDGRHLELRIEPVGDAAIEVIGDGQVHRPGGGHIDIVGTPPLWLKVTALTEARPLIPIRSVDLLQPGVEADERDLQALAFLTYEEKLLAGSWRFLTYFGRDTLLSTMLMMPALEPAVAEAALGSVVDRMGSNGEVAHEEDIGDYALLVADEEWTRLPDAMPPPELLGWAPRLDYTMVDDDFLLASVLAHYLLDTPGGRERAEAFLDREVGGRTYREWVRLNLEYVMDQAEPYAVEASPSNLISLKPGRNTGEWRDSEEGLGGGRYPYNVNAVLVPAALHATHELLASPLLAEPEAAARAERLALAWQPAYRHFEVVIPADEAVARVTAYARELGLDPAAAAASLDGPVVFPALALDAAGQPIPVMHSDDGFALLFGKPAAAQLDRVADRVLRPFPAGLRTPAGIVVANPAYADDAELRALFSRAHYHGTVIWSWQQALLADGLAWQRHRGDVPQTTRDRLAAAQAALWEGIEATAHLRRSELWSWEVVDGAIVPVPFGRDAGHHSESNAVQLWSTVFIAVRPPQE